MLHTNKAISYMDQLLIKKDKEIERTKKILADHNERIRILELAIQQCLGPMMDSMEVTRMYLNKAMKESHNIALREYP